MTGTRADFEAWCDKPWHVLRSLDMLYLDDREHPVPTVPRRPGRDPGRAGDAGRV